jgi:uncharacterized protein (TIGR00255 family)
MTGYASAQKSQAGPGRIGVEIRSVNSRFLDLSFKLPEDLRSHEAALRDLLQGQLKRGKVEVRAFIESTQAGGPREPSPAQLQRLNGLQDAITAWLPQAPLLSVADVLRLTSDDRPDTTGAGESLLTLTRQCLQELRLAREREGARLTSLLQDKAAQIATLAARVEPLVPQVVAHNRQRFVERWNDALAAAQAGGAGHTVSEQAAQDRALAEATAFAIRIDVAEELARLQSHLAEIRQQLTQGGEIGKRLDFLIQELHREANTLGSKSAALELTQIAIDMKVLIEQMREQVQNIE